MRNSGVEGIQFIVGVPEIEDTLFEFLVEFADLFLCALVVGNIFDTPS